MEPLPRIDSWGAATAGSRATADMTGTAGPQPVIADKESQVAQIFLPVHCPLKVTITFRHDSLKVSESQG